MLRGELRAAWPAGETAAPLLADYWERHWTTPIETSRAELGVAPAVDWEHLAASPNVTFPNVTCPRRHLSPPSEDRQHEGTSTSTPSDKFT